MSPPWHTEGDRQGELLGDGLPQVLLQRVLLLGGPEQVDGGHLV